jgi:galactokinase
MQMSPLTTGPVAVTSLPAVEIDRPGRGDFTVDARAVVDALLAVEPAAAAHPEAVRVVRAPGRVNLIGEHTDYNNGLVLPMAIDRSIWISYVQTDDRSVVLTRFPYVQTADRSVVLTRFDAGERRGFDLDSGRAADGTWLDYVAGTAQALTDAHLPTHGLRGVIGSNLLEGVGLSSSAAIELASAWALLGGRADELEPLALARICQQAENLYVGVQSGLMDQFAEACGVAGHALFMDCRSLDWRAVPIPDEISVVVCDTGSPRRLDGSAYNVRRSQCQAAVTGLAASDPAVRSLRDVTIDMLAAERHRLDPVVAARAEHVVAENARVQAMVAALEIGDAAMIGETLFASHDSLRRLYDVSSPELDALVEIAASVPGVIGARMTGAGFGGCTVNLVRVGAVEALRDAVTSMYVSRTGLTPSIFQVEAADGVGLS